MADHAGGHEHDAYHPADTIGETIKALLITGGAGLFISSIQNTLTKQNVGVLGVFTKTGGTVTTYAAMGSAYTFVKHASANLREKDDTWNTAYGGFASGAMLGLRARSLPALLGYGTLVSVVLSAFTFTGGKLSGYDRDPTVDEVARKEFLRKNRRRSIEETVSELGEGRGIRAPGYEERRAQRIKERYGIEVPLPASS